LTRLARYTAGKYRRLTLRGRWCFRPLGGLQVATTEERMAELRRQHGWASSWGVGGTIVSPRDCARLHPLLDPDAVIGGLYVPGDGLAAPLRAAEAQARAAASRGAQFLEHRKVVDIDCNAEHVTGVRTETERFRADVVVSAAGLWGPRIGAMVDLAVPLVPMAYQYATTTPLKALTGADREQSEASKPILRDPDARLQLHEHVDRLGIGGLTCRPTPVSLDDIGMRAEGHAIPAELWFSLEEFEESWSAAVRLLPGLSESKVDDGIKGLSPFTPDGNPLLGEHPRLSGFWVAEGVWAPHSAGAASALARWLTDGTPGIDLHDCDLNRFEQPQLSPGYVRARSARTYARIYDAVHPAGPSGEPRDLRISPFHDRQIGLSADFRETAGWERPQYFGVNENLPEMVEVPARSGWAARHWSPVEGAEALAARNRVALFDMTPLKRLEITGPGALSFLQTMTTSQLDRPPGSATYTLLLAEDGGIRSDLTVARLAPDYFLAGIGGNLGLDWLRRNRPPDETVQLTDITPGTCCLGVWGPLARTLVQPLCDHELSARAERGVYIGDVPVTALRLSAVGEPGWELHTTSEYGRKLWDTLWDAGRPLGVLAAGYGALSSMRLEKGRRVWGTDMTTEHDPYAAGLGFAVALCKGYFLGREALVGRAAVQRSLVPLTMDDAHQLVMGSEPVYSRGKRVGYVTSAGYGYSVAKSIAYVWLPVALGVPGTGVDVEYFGERVPATVATEPLYDPGPARVGNGQQSFEGSRSSACVPTT
jgi:glycine cleavage system aminomethyltransferase T/glycine/D-amino acid oxidase-like deaminating enzyme